MSDKLSGKVNLTSVMIFQLQRIARRMLLTVMWVALGCTLIIPVGYMPAAGGSGSAVILCPSFLPAGFAQGHDTHHGAGHASKHHTPAETPEELRPVYCPLGALAGTLVLLDSISFDSLAVSPIQPSVVSVRDAIQPLRTPFHSRAPPSILT